MNSTMGKSIAVAVVLLVIGVLIGVFVLGDDGEESNTVQPQQSENNSDEGNDTSQESVENDGKEANQEIRVATVEEYTTYCSVLSSDTLSSYHSWGELVEGVVLDRVRAVVPPDEVIDYHNLSLDAWDEILEYAATQPQEAVIDRSAQEILGADEVLISVSHQIDPDTLNTLIDAGCIAVTRGRI